jgi:hypothetical protein
MKDTLAAVIHPYGAPLASKMHSHFVERWFFPDGPAGQIKKPPYWVADCALADGMRDGLMRATPWAISHPYGAPLASKMRSHFVERWFFADEPAGQIKKPPYWVADCVWLREWVMD